MDTLILQALNVLIVMGFLYYFLFKPVGSIIEKRERFVEDSLARAAQAKEEAERLLAQYQSQVRQAQVEAQRIVEKAALDAEEYTRRRRAEADTDAERTLSRARAEIAAERERALAAIRDEVATLAILAAGRVVGKVLDREDHRRLVAEFVADLERVREVEKVGELQ